MYLLIVLAFATLTLADDDSRGLLFCDGNDKVFYYLYTDENPDEAQEISSHNYTAIEYSNFRAECSTILFTHGWQSEAEAEGSQVIKDGVLESESYQCVNILLVDWSECASNIDYFGPAFYVDNVGNMICQLLEFLIANLSTPIENIHIIGHSLGAHVSGFAGKCLQKNGLNLEWITGLDPAAPLFYKLPETHRLSMNDATCVETLHTTQGAGFPCELGRVSYFVNGGTVQPGCVPSSNLISVETCSHSIAHNYYAEAIRLGNDNLFYSEKCENRNCCQEKADEEQKPGTNSTCKNSGIFAFNTHPYGLNATEYYGLGTDGAVSCSGKECYQNSIFYPCKGDKCRN